MRGLYTHDNQGPHVNARLSRWEHRFSEHDEPVAQRPHPPASTHTTCQRTNHLTLDPATYAGHGTLRGHSRWQERGMRQGTSSFVSGSLIDRRW